MKLFERMNRSIYITESGELLLQYTDTILNQFEESTTIIRNGQLSKNCHLGVNISYAETSLAGLVRQIEALYPDITLKICINNTETIEKMLTDNKIDLAIIDKISDTPNRISHPLNNEEMVLVCAPGLYKDNISLGELAAEKLLVREKGSAHRNIIDAAFHAAGYEIEPKAQSVSSLALISLAEAGIGFSILPYKSVAASLDAGRLLQINISDATFLRHYHLVYHEKKYLTRAIENVKDTILNFY